MCDTVHLQLSHNVGVVMNFIEIFQSDIFKGILGAMGIFAFGIILIILDDWLDKKIERQRREEDRVRKVEEAARMEREAQAAIQAAIRANFEFAAVIKKLVKTHEIKGHTSDALIEKVVGNYCTKPREVAEVRAVVCTLSDCEIGME